MKFSVVSFVCVLTAASLAACGGPSVHVKHPLDAGALNFAESLVVSERREPERARDITAGSLSEKAMLVSASAHELCVQVQLVVLGNDSGDDPETWTRSLVMQGGSERTLANAVVTSLKDTMTAEQGGENVWKATGGTETSCQFPKGDGGCAGWQTKPAMGMVYERRGYVLRHRDYRICFAEPGLSAQTSSVTLRLKPSEERGVNHEERSFRWKFD